MNQFQEMLKEAFMGEEPFDASPGRAALEASIRKFEQRDRTLRYMIWFAVIFMSAVCGWAAWSFFSSDDASATYGAGSPCRRRSDSTRSSTAPCIPGGRGTS